MKNITLAILFAFSAIVGGCAGSDNTPDMMVFADSSVVDMQVSPDGGVLPTEDVGMVDSPDMGIVVMVDAGPEDTGVIVVDDAGVDAFVPPVDAGPVDSDGDGVPDSEDECPGFDDNVDLDGDMIPDDCDNFVLPVVEFSSYPVEYVWVAQVGVNTYELAEAACADRGGHVPVFSGGLNNGLDVNDLLDDLDNLQTLAPAGRLCTSPAPTTSACATTYGLLTPQYNNCVSSFCDYYRTNPNGRSNAVVAFNNTNGNWDQYCTNGTSINDCSGIVNFALNVNVLCVLPTNGGDFTNPGLSDYDGVESTVY